MIWRSDRLAAVALRRKPLTYRAGNLVQPEKLRV
ncbi:Uncharacterised protein [Serratia marcescens]|nr:Uncharacterised protein [Serratia marcescens]CVA30746.1 Uncharacterised protein [Serratia marcescens]CVA37022.1 Uncharacterised protein [Serratia marcescens]CVA90623.1 Uncharacterised protein [Serratia marcescens]CVB32024.1 Uncharacterised protein [Serratia marcescens]